MKEITTTQEQPVVCQCFQVSNSKNSMDKNENLKVVFSGNGKR
jgi:hypothetical protein